MVEGFKWKWQVRVLLERLRVWSFLNTLRLVYSYLIKRPHESEFRFLANFQGQKGLLIDVGANLGQSVVSSRIFNRSYSILSFEPNPHHGSDLKRIKTIFGLNKFEYHLVGLGDQIGSLQFFIPEVQGVPLTQEATLSRESLLADEDTQKRILETTGQKKFSVKETLVPLRKLDDYCVKPDFVKLDVQFSELQVIQGMKETLQSSYPILIVENSPHLLAIIEYLAPLQYKPYEYDRTKNRLEPSGFGANCMNLFFVPKNRLAWLGSLIS
jgi:FkbM family methyltransferase